MAEKRTQELEKQIGRRDAEIKVLKGTVNKALQETVGHDRIRDVITQLKQDSNRRNAERTESTQVFFILLLQDVNAQS